MTGLFQYKDTGIPIIMTKQSQDHLTFIMGIPVSGKMVFMFEWDPTLIQYKDVILPV